MKNRSLLVLIYIFFSTTLFAQVGINTSNPQNTLEVNSGTTNQSGVRFTELKNPSTSTIGKSIGVDANGDVIALDRVGTVFIGRVLPNSTIATGYNYIPLEPIYDPENRYNSSNFQWKPPTGDNSIYEVTVTLQRFDGGTIPFNIHRPNSANLIYLPTTTSQFFSYNYTGIYSKKENPKILGAQNLGIFMNNNSGATYTFTDTLVYVDRGYWTITIKRIGNK